MDFGVPSVALKTKKGVPSKKTPIQSIAIHHQCGWLKFGDPRGCSGSKGVRPKSTSCQVNTNISMYKYIYIYIHIHTYSGSPTMGCLP